MIKFPKLKVNGEYKINPKSAQSKE
jgi:hypothetical protein